MKERMRLTQAKRIVIKVGTQVLMDEANINALIPQMAALNQQGKEVIFVTSGAIGAGLQTLGMKTRPTKLADLQMAASVGQTTLLHRYYHAFNQYHCIISQVLLTHADLKHRRRHLNARNTMLNLLHRGIIPIVNENDVVSVDEIQVGDNDLLSALVCVLIEADLLILLTSPDGLQQPGQDNQSERIPYLAKITNKTHRLVKPKDNPLSTGGMETKLQASKIANRSGASVIIARGSQENVLTDIVAGKDIGTLIGHQKSGEPLAHRKRWLRYFHRPQGRIVIDDGAKNALLTSGKSLLAVGITDVEGVFPAGSFVDIVDQKKRVIAQGLVEFSNSDIQKIKGQHSSVILQLLGPNQYDEVVHRNNLIIQVK